MWDLAGGRLEWESGNGVRVFLGPGQSRVVRVLGGGDGGRAVEVVYGDWVVGREEELDAEDGCMGKVDYMDL